MVPNQPFGLSTDSGDSSEVIQGAPTSSWLEPGQPGKDRQQNDPV